MEKIKLTNGVLLDFTMISQNASSLEVEFPNQELDTLRSLFEVVSNVEVLEVLTEGDVIATVLIGYIHVGKYIVTAESITVELIKLNETEQKISNLEVEVLSLQETVDTLVLASLGI